MSYRETRENIKIPVSISLGKFDISFLLVKTSEYKISYVGLKRIHELSIKGIVIIFRSYIFAFHYIFIMLKLILFFNFVQKLCFGISSS